MTSFVFQLILTLPTGSLLKYVRYCSDYRMFVLQWHIYLIVQDAAKKVEATMGIQNISQGRAMIVERYKKTKDLWGFNFH